MDAFRIIMGSFCIIMDAFRMIMGAFRIIRPLAGYGLPPPPGGIL